MERDSDSEEPQVPEGESLETDIVVEPEDLVVRPTVTLGAVVKRRASSRAKSSLARLLLNSTGLRRAVLMMETFAPPLALRPPK